MSIMLFIKNISGYLKLLNNDKAKKFVVINFGEYFKSTGEIFLKKLSEESESSYIFNHLIFLPDEVEYYVEMI